MNELSTKSRARWYSYVKFMMISVVSELMIVSPEWMKFLHFPDSGFNSFLPEAKPFVRTIRVHKRLLHRFALHLVGSDSRKRFLVQRRIR
jgi:hypothetical protein